MAITVKGLEVANLSIQHKHIKLQLLNFDQAVISTLEGYCVSGSLSKDADSALRRSGSVRMCVPINRSATNFLDAVNGVTVAYGGKIWIDKLVKIFVGIADNAGYIVWHSFGICLIDQPVRTFSANEYTITFNVLDMMGRYTGERQGQLPYLAVSYPRTQTIAGQIVKNETLEALTSAITQVAGIKKYTIFPLPAKYKYLPYNVNVSVGATAYELLSKFMAILSGWQMYFDDDGVLTIEPIPSGRNTVVYPLNVGSFTADNLSSDFHSAKNQIIVYGRTTSAQRYATLTFYSGRTLDLTFSTIGQDSWVVGSTVLAFQAPFDYTSLRLYNLSIHGVTEQGFDCKLVGFNGDESFVNGSVIVPGEIYCIRLIKASYDSDGKIITGDSDKPIVFEFLGKQSVSWCSVNENPQSPFYINAGIIGENYYGGTAKAVIGTADTRTYKTGEYTVDIPVEPTVTSISNGTVITCMVNLTNAVTSYGYPTLTVRSTYNVTSPILSKVPIRRRNGKPVLEGDIGSGYVIWKFVYDSANGGQFYFEGEYERVITDIKSGGDYENIYSDQLAKERSDYELFLASYITNDISLTCVPNYGLDVNLKIMYAESDAYPPSVPNPDEQAYEPYLVKRINYPLDIGNVSQNIEAVRVYDDYELVGNDYEVVTEEATTMITILQNLTNCTLYNAYYFEDYSAVFICLEGREISSAVPNGVELYWQAKANSGYAFEGNEQYTSGSFVVDTNTRTITAKAEMWQ